VARKLNDLIATTLSRRPAAGRGLTLNSRGKIPFELLGDAPDAGDVIRWNTDATTGVGQWEAIDPLTVAPSGVAAGDLLMWNGSAWEETTFGTLAAGDMIQWNGSDWEETTTTSLASGEYMRWNGSDWVNAELLLGDVEQGGAATGDLLTWTGAAWDDTTLGTLVAGDLLQWNGSAWEVVTTTGLASGDLLEWNGSDWVNKSPGTSNLAWTHFFSHTMGSDAAEVEFSSIPQTWKHFKILARLGHTVGAVVVDMFVNDDTDANYHYQYVQAYGTTYASASLFGQTVARIGACGGNVDYRLDTLELTFFDYQNTGLDHRWSSEIMRSDAVTSGTLVIERTLGIYDVTGNYITQINIKPGSGNFRAGSTFDLYGIGDGT
jgi:hypothetical protein